MKGKTIKSNLRWKINDWIKSIEDEDLRKLMQKNVIVTGGSIVSMLLGDQVNDYDIYFRSVNAASQIANYYVNRFLAEKKWDTPGIEVPVWVVTEDPTPQRENLEDPFGDPLPATPGSVSIMVKSAGVVKEGHTEEYQYFEAAPDEVGEHYATEAMTPVESNLEAGDEVPAELIEDKEKPKYRAVFISANAITLSNGIQLVVRFIGEPEVIHKYYDFVHCTCFWKCWDGELVLPAAALEAIITKELRYVGSLYPLCSIIRIRKFVARGWHINAGQILKMCVQLGNLDLSDINVLQDQLTGVDAFYFRQIIDRLKEKQTEEGQDGKPIDSTYLMTIIDRMF